MELELDSMTVFMGHFQLGTFYGSMMWKRGDNFHQDHTQNSSDLRMDVKMGKIHSATCWIDFKM